MFLVVPATDGKLLTDPRSDGIFVCDGSAVADGRRDLSRTDDHVFLSVVCLRG